MKGFRPYLAIALVAGLGGAPIPSYAQHNVRPSAGNVYNTPTARAAHSPEFRCGARVSTVWTGSGGTTYVAFSDDNIWYSVMDAHMRPLLYTAYALGKSVCYQTKGGASDNIKVNVVFLAPEH